MQAGSNIDVEALARYFQSRQNPDGGFCFYSLDESNLSDTCYAVLSLHIIGLCQIIFAWSITSVHTSSLMAAFMAFMPPGS